MRCLRQGSPCRPWKLTNQPDTPWKRTLKGLNTPFSGIKARSCTAWRDQEWEVQSWSGREHGCYLGTSDPQQGQGELIVAKSALWSKKSRQNTILDYCTSESSSLLAIGCRTRSWSLARWLHWKNTRLVPT